ncbi:MAG: hypothetical protein PHI28_05735 [Mangrovibacterium sp.]|nr:hypothetical protein [Mangrovibacterium sp.]
MKQYLNSIILSFIVFLNCPASNKENEAGKLEDEAGELLIGWSSVDITPDKPVLLNGQYHARVSEGVMDPVTATVLALESGDGKNSEKALLISCDLVSIRDGSKDQDNNLRKTVRDKLTRAIPGLDPGQIILNATHTHTAPYCSSDPDSKSIYGVELDAMAPYECLEFISERIVEAGKKAWNNRKPGGISYGLGHAVVGHNRLAIYSSGKSQMYGNTNRKDFIHIEGFEDHSVNLLYTWDKNSKLTGIVVNVACPAQVSEQIYEVSADYWHDARLEIRERLGDDLFILPQCSAAGDQSPHFMIGNKAEGRMQRLINPDATTGRGSIGRRKQIAVSIADAVSSVCPYMKDQIEWAPAFVHRMEGVELSRRLLSPDDVSNALKEAEGYKKHYDELLAAIQENPSIKQKQGWSFDITSTYSQMNRGLIVKDRYELEKVQPKMVVEVHVIRLGDIVFATNPFELYLDYGMRIKGRSPAVQTFLVQLAGSGTYVPTSRSITGGGYGAVPASTLIGTKGGEELVEKTLEMINAVWHNNE